MTTSGYREIDHTADLGFDLWADSISGLFAEAVLALSEVCYERTAVLWAEERILEVRGADPEEQLVRWLQETYMQLESGLWLTAAATNVVVEGEMVKGTLHGEAIDPARHTLHSEIKAITYHGMKIVREHGLWRTTVVVDV